MLLIFDYNLWKIPRMLYVVVLCIKRSVAYYGIHCHANSCLRQNVLYCMHWLQHSMHDIVK